MSDDDSWDRDDFVPPPVAKPAAGEKKFEDEDEEDKKGDSVEGLRSQLERLQREFDSYRKSVEAAKEKKNQKKREEEELLGMLNEADRKAKEKMLMEEADLASAKELFGAAPTSSASSASAAAAKEAPKDELSRFVELVTTKLQGFSKAPEYPAQAEKLVYSALQNLNHERLKEMGDKITSDAREKAKVAQAQKKVEKQQKAKKPVAGGGVKANSKKFAELDDLDYLGGGDDDDYYDDDY